MRLLQFSLIGILVLISVFVKSQDTLKYQQLCSLILESEDAEQKLIWSTQLYQNLLSKLETSDDLKPLDSTALLFDLISKENDFQIITWAIEFNDQWEYYGLLKTYNQVQKKYFVYDLLSTNLKGAGSESSRHDENNWPAGVYTELIENEYNKRKYFTFIGWLAPSDQTSFKFLEVMTLSKSGKPYFGKINYFKRGKEYNKRQLFSYSRQSKFLLDYGEYDYITKTWNRKKKKYDVDKHSENLIVFDHLISQYPSMTELPEFMVPVGNLIDAFKFKNGKWVYISDIDARNMKRKDSKSENPQLNLFENPNSKENN